MRKLQKKKKLNIYYTIQLWPIQSVFTSSKMATRWQRSSSWMTAYTETFFGLQSPLLFYFIFEDPVCLIKISQSCIWRVWGELIQEISVARLLNLSPVRCSSHHLSRGICFSPKAEIGLKQAWFYRALLHSTERPRTSYHPMRMRHAKWKGQKCFFFSTIISPNLKGFTEPPLTQSSLVVKIELTLFTHCYG